MSIVVEVQEILVYVSDCEKVYGKRRSEPTSNLSSNIEVHTMFFIDVVTEFASLILILLFSPPVGRDSCAPNKPKCV